MSTPPRTSTPDDYDAWLSRHNREWQFLAESNAIEGIQRGPTDQELNAFLSFLELATVNVADLQALVSVFQPGAVLRDKTGLNVRVGRYYPPRGGPDITRRLKEDVLFHANAAPILQKVAVGQWAYGVHRSYESLHPFTDGNGRSGRMLWWKMMGGSDLGFLHQWYYQSLENHRG